MANATTNAMANSIANKESSPGVHFTGSLPRRSRARGAAWDLAPYYADAF